MRRALRVMASRMVNHLAHGIAAVLFLAGIGLPQATPPPQAGPILSSTLRIGFASGPKVGTKECEAAMDELRNSWNMGQHRNVDIIDLGHWSSARKHLEGMALELVVVLDSAKSSRANPKTGKYKDGEGTRRVQYKGANAEAKLSLYDPSETKAPLLSLEREWNAGSPPPFVQLGKNQNEVKRDPASLQARLVGHVSVEMLEYQQSLAVWRRKAELPIIVRTIGGSQALELWQSLAWLVEVRNGPVPLMSLAEASVEAWRAAIRDYQLSPQTFVAQDCCQWCAEEVEDEVEGCACARSRSLHLAKGVLESALKAHVDRSKWSQTTRTIEGLELPPHRPGEATAGVDALADVLQRASVAARASATEWVNRPSHNSPRSDWPQLFLFFEDPVELPTLDEDFLVYVRRLVFKGRLNSQYIRVLRIKTKHPVLAYVDRIEGKYEILKMVPLKKGFDGDVFAELLEQNLITHFTRRNSSG